MQLELIRGPVVDDLRRVDQTIVERLASDIVLVNQISQYIIGSGGKRLRPLSVVLAARACGRLCRPRKAWGQKAPCCPPSRLIFRSNS